MTKKRTFKNCAIFSMGGLVYCAVEILWRGYTHWSMLLTGGCCCVVLIRVFEKVSNLRTYSKCIIGSGIITLIEFISGCIFNIWLKLGVWDYSNMPLNVLGQICPLYSAFWALLSIPLIKGCSLINSKNSISK